MDKEHYKTLTTKESQLEYMDVVRKSRKKAWDEVNGDKVYEYRRATTLRRCEQRISVPTKKTIEKYTFTQEELKPIFDALWSDRFAVNSNSDENDKEDNLEENI